MFPRSKIGRLTLRGQWRSFFNFDEIKNGYDQTKVYLRAIWKYKKIGSISIIGIHIGSPRSNLKLSKTRWILFWIQRHVRFLERTHDSATFISLRKICRSNNNDSVGKYRMWNKYIIDYWILFSLKIGIWTPRVNIKNKYDIGLL